MIPPAGQRTSITQPISSERKMSIDSHAPAAAAMMILSDWLSVLHGFPFESYSSAPCHQPCPVADQGHRTGLSECGAQLSRLRIGMVVWSLCTGFEQRSVV